MWITALNPQMLIATKRKCGAVAYQYGGSGRTLTRINNTPHPYDRRLWTSREKSYAVMSVCILASWNLPDFRTRRKHTLSSICLRGPEDPQCKYRQIIQHSEWGIGILSKTMTKLTITPDKSTSISSICEILLCSSENDAKFDDSSEHYRLLKTHLPLL